MANVVGMQSPWVNYTNKIRELFKNDPAIKMEWSDKTLELKMYVEGTAKAEALTHILPTSVDFPGNHTVKITIIPANGEFAFAGSQEAKWISDAFEGNPLFSRVITSQFNYCVFHPTVIQYFNDDLSDPWGNAHALPEDLARDVLNVNGMFYATESFSTTKE